jgi:hypothetical protein
LYTYNNFLTHTIVPIFTVKIIQNFFIKPFIKFFKKLVFSRYGLYTNNFTKSLSYHTVKNLLHLTFKQPYNFTKTYLHPIAILNFSFHKSTYNTLIIYILFLITHTYLNNFTNFSLWYSYILIPKHFYILNFCNNYYFKLHHL